MSGSEKEQGKYIYCIIETKQDLSFGYSSIGNTENEVHTICAGNLTAVVSNSPVKRYIATRDNLLAHAKTIETVMKKYTVLPVRFCTIAENEDKIKRILKGEHIRFSKLLNMIEGKKELGIKAFFNKDIIYKDILEKYHDIKILKEKIKNLSPEQTHYKLMEIGQMVESALEAEKEKLRENILNNLVPLAVDVKINKVFGEMMIVNSAFLVERNNETDFDKKIQKLADEHAEKIKILYVGTLPPYNFVNLIITMEKY